MTAAPTSIALFPLNIVLFPDGPLPLRIFETRYVDMVRRCMREDADIRRGADPRGQARSGLPKHSMSVRWRRSSISISYRTACSGLSCVGQQRFRIQSRSRQADGLNLAEVEWLLPEPSDRGAGATCAAAGIAENRAAATRRGVRGHRDASGRCGVGRAPPRGNSADCRSQTSNSAWNSTIRFSGWMRLALWP